MKNELQWKSHNGKVSVSIIESFQNRIGFKFPQLYISIVSNYDRAQVANHLNAFDFYSNLTKEIVSYGIGCFLAYKEDYGSLIEKYWDEKNLDLDYPFPDNIVPIIDDGGGNLICFDYRHDISTNEPKIVVWHHEGIGTEGELSFVANSFDEFLDMLYDSRSEEKKERDRNFKWSWEE